MWKKIFAASAVAVGIAGILGAGDAFAAITTDSYTPGQEISLSTNYDVCVQKNGGYGGGLIIADIRGINYEKQIVFDSFATNWRCVSVENIPSGSKIKFVTPMGIGDMMYTQSGSNTQHTVTLVLDSATDVDGYLRSYGMTATKIAKTMATISFDANGGAGAIPAITGATIGSSVTLPRNTLTRNGYRFTGWNTKADGTGEHYNNAETITLGDDTTGEIVLYAEWVVDEAVLDAGRTVNVKLKQQAGTAASSYDYVDTRIKAIRRADALPGGFDVNDSDNIISSDDSANKIYSWFDDSDRDNDGEGDGTIYYYSEASNIKGGYDMVGIFGWMQELADISGVTNLDVSGTGYMHSLFHNDSKLADISPLSGWDTSSCVSLNGVFSGASLLEDIAPIAYWNTSKVKDLSGLFRKTSITSVDALETKRHPGKDYISWDTSNVELLTDIFSFDRSLVDISAVASWDTSKVKGMSDAFMGASALSDISALANWDTSMVEDMQSVFAYASAIADYSPLSSWNTSSVIYMGHMFISGALTNLDAFETKQYPGKDYVSWDVSNVKSMLKVFSGNRNLEDISALASWNTASLENMSYLVAGSLITNVDALETKQYPGRDYVSWNVSNVKDMSAVFDECSRLSDISKLSTWDVSSATDMTRLFYRDYSLSSLAPIFGWMSDSSAVTMTEIFDGVPVAVARPDWYHE